LAVRKILGDALGAEFVGSGLGEEVETDDAFAATLALLPAGFLERHIETGEGIPVLCNPRGFFSALERPLGGEVIHLHELLLAVLAELLKLGWGHDGILGKLARIAKWNFSLSAMIGGFRSVETVLRRGHQS